MVFKIIDGLNVVFQTANLNSRRRPGPPKCCGPDKRVAKRYFYTLKSWLIRTASSRARTYRRTGGRTESLLSATKLSDAPSSSGVGVGDATLLAQYGLIAERLPARRAQL
jgi:hypothetical protein